MLWSMVSQRVRHDLATEHNNPRNKDKQADIRERQILYISIYMAFRKMMPAILHAGYQRRHRCKEQTLDSVGEGEDV